MDIDVRTISCLSEISHDYTESYMRGDLGEVAIQLRLRLFLTRNPQLLDPVLALVVQLLQPRVW